jgi:archaellum biogenesis ATPase FlaH
MSDTSTAQKINLPKTKNPFLAAALAYAVLLGWPVLPLWPRSKNPHTTHGFQDATVDENQIRRWWKMWPDANIGVPTGVKFFVLDRDPRNGGSETYQHLIYQHGSLGGTIAQTTGRGGESTHWLFAMPDQQEIGCHTGLWPGLDIKGVGGYIVVPPSIHPDTGQPYTWDGLKPITEQTLLPAPGWLLTEIGTAQHKAKSEPVQVPGHISYGKQHDTLFKLGSAMRAKGFEEDEIFAALWACNIKRCEKPGPEENIRKLAHSICLQYAAGPSQSNADGEPRDEDAPPPRFRAQDDSGQSSGGAQASEEPPSDGEAKRSPVFTYKDVPSIWRCEAKISYLIPDLLPEGCIALLTGDSGHGKSMFATAMAGAIVNGGEFLGRKAVRRKMLYLDRENPLSVAKKHLFDLHINETPDLKYWGEWCEQEADGPASVSLYEFASAEKPVLIFDSLIAFHTGDEQDATETRRYLRRYRRLTAAGATVILLHHIGKTEGAKQYRGSSDIKAAVDLGLLLEKLGDPAGLLSELRLVPFKNRIGASKTMPISFREGAFVANEKRPPTDRETFEPILRTHPNSTGKELTKLGMAAGLSKHRVEELLADGISNGWIETHLGKRNARYYSLAETRVGL